MEFKYKLGFIGYGNMAQAISQGIVGSNLLKSEEMAIFDPNNEVMAKMKGKGYNIANDNIEIVENCEYVFFAVKPQMFEVVAKEIKSAYKGNKLISILAGTTITEFKEVFGEECQITRAMPNTPALVGRGITGVDVSLLDDIAKAFVLKLFGSIGEVIEIKENRINDIIAISGSGPAYVYLFIKGMYENALAHGFSAEIAKKLVVGTVQGSAEMFKQSSENIDTLVERVCSKGGTTIEAVKTFQREGLGNLIDKAIKDCYDRAVELSDNK